MAELAHNVNTTYSTAKGETGHVDWEEAPVWQRETMIAGVAFLLANPNATPEETHNSWMAKKEEDGWRYGHIKDPENKFHPCMRPYYQLPLDQRVKDSLFLAVVRTLEKRL